MRTSRKFAMFVMPALLCAALSAAGFPQAGKPVRLVVPFPAGSPAFDGTARILADRLEVWGPHGLPADTVRRLN